MVLLKRARSAPSSHRRDPASPRSDRSAWLTYFTRGNRVISHAGLQKARYERCAEAILEAMSPPPGARMLDFGCGDCLAASRYLERGIQLTLYDNAPSVVAGLSQRFPSPGPVRLLTPGAYERLLPAQFDLITVHSVIQYVPRDRLPAMLERWSTLLVPGGLLLLSDLIPPARSMLPDVLALLRFGAHEGMLLPALSGLLRTITSSYRGGYQVSRLTRHDEGDLCGQLVSAGFQVKLLPRNPGPFSSRKALLAQRLPVRPDQRLHSANATPGTTRGT